MKKGLVLACSAMALVVAMGSAAEARDGFYLTARGGMTWNNLNSKKDAISEDKVSKLDHVGVYSGAIGYKYKYLRSEFEYVWRADAEEDISTDGHDSGSMSVKSESYMFNMYLDFMPNYWISPYIGGGIGMSKMELTNKNEGILPAEVCGFSKYFSVSSSTISFLIVALLKPKLYFSTIVALLTGSAVFIYSSITAFKICFFLSFNNISTSF
jgi:opacity protein-like surface antigen